MSDGVTGPERPFSNPIPLRAFEPDEQIEPATEMVVDKDGARISVLLDPRVAYVLAFSAPERQRLSATLAWAVLGLGILAAYTMFL